MAKRLDDAKRVRSHKPHTHMPNWACKAINALEYQDSNYLHVNTTWNMFGFFLLFLLCCCCCCVFCGIPTIFDTVWGNHHAAPFQQSSYLFISCILLPTILDSYCASMYVRWSFSHTQKKTGIFDFIAHTHASTFECIYARAYSRYDLSGLVCDVWCKF